MDLDIDVVAVGGFSGDVEEAAGVGGELGEVDPADDAAGGGDAGVEAGLEFVSVGAVEFEGGVGGVVGEGGSGGGGVDGGAGGEGAGLAVDAAVGVVELVVGEEAGGVFDGLGVIGGGVEGGGGGEKGQRKGQKG